MSDKTEQTDCEPVNTTLEEEAVTIPSPYAKKWYDLGFLFAVNYIYRILPAPTTEPNDPNEFNSINFKEFINNRITITDGKKEKGVVEDTYLDVTFPFRRNGPINYPGGQCPGDLPNTCIPCTSNRITPIP